MDACAIFDDNTVIAEDPEVPLVVVLVLTSPHRFKVSWYTLSALPITFALAQHCIRGLKSSSLKEHPLFGGKESLDAPNGKADRSCLTGGAFLLVKVFFVVVDDVVFLDDGNPA